MNIHHVLLVFLCCVCVCVCDTNSTVRVVANQTTENPGDCDLSKCPSSCTRVFFSERDSMCVFLRCDDNVTCDDFITELRGQAKDAQEKGADLPQPTAPPLKSPLSSSPTALLASPSASAAASSPPAPPSVPDRKQSSVSSNSSDSSFNSNTSRSSQVGDQGQIQNNSTMDGEQGEAQNRTLQNGTLLQLLNSSLQNEHAGQPPVQSSSPAPPTPPVPVESVGAENTSLTTPKDQTGTQVIQTGQETNTTTTTTTSTSVKSNSTTRPSTTCITTAVTMTTTSATTSTTSTTSKVTIPPSTTQTRPTSTPPPTPPPSAAPPSVTPSTLPPGQNLSTTTPKVPDVTSDQDKAIVETAGGKFSSHLVNTSSLIAILIFGLLFFIVTIVLFLRHAYESYKRRGYTQMDYLINGMYSDSGL